MNRWMTAFALGAKCGGLGANRSAFSAAPAGCQQRGERGLAETVAAVAEEVPACDRGHRSLLRHELVEVEDSAGGGGPRGPLGGPLGRHGAWAGDRAGALGIGGEPHFLRLVKPGKAGRLVGRRRADEAETEQVRDAV